MSRNPYNLVFLIGLVIGSLGLLFGAAYAQSPSCTDSALVQVQPNFKLNVRAQSGGIGQILRTITDKSGELRAVEERSGFLRLENGGWIVNRYLNVLCWGFRTPTPVLTQPVVIVTQMPLPTPTQIQHNLMWCSSEPEVKKIGESWIVECKR